MFRNSKKDEVNQILDKWFTIIHNDLCNIRVENVNKNRTKREKEIYSQLRGLRDSILLEACSGVGYVYEDKFYSDLTSLSQVIDDPEKEIPVERVINIDYLLHFIDQILEK